MTFSTTFPDGFNLSDADDIALMAEYNPSVVAARIGLVCTLYVPNQHDENTRNKLATCGDMYTKNFGNEIHLYQSATGLGKFKNYPKRGVSLTEMVKSHLQPKQPFTPSFIGSTSPDDASQYSLTILALGTKFFKIGQIPATFYATFPIKFALNRQDLDVNPFLGLVLEWCKLLQPDSGLAGLGLIQSVDWGEHRRTIKQITPLALRFPGLDAGNPNVVGNEIGDKIKGVNWITIVSDRILQSIGGRDVVISELDPTIFPVYDFGGGIAIQAGPAPQIGDNNRRNDLIHYKTVGRLLKPLRMSFPDTHTLLDLGNGRGTDVTNQWLARFE